MGKSSREKRHKKNSSDRDRDSENRRRKRDRYRSDSEDDSSDEEDRRRRDAAKTAKRVEEHLKKHGGGGGFGYTDEDNPFNDPRLSERFVWGKKIEKQLVEGADIKDLTSRAEARRQAERLEEIEKVKRRREQREAERAALAEELELIQRERAMAEAVDLERKEEEFHLEQVKVRARQRLEAGRPKAIDLITNNLFLLDGFDAAEQDPATIIAGLNVWQLRDLVRDVEDYAALDARDTSHAPFWHALTTVAQHELAEATRQEDIDRARVRGLPVPEKYLIREPGWHESLDADIAVMLAGKSHAELASLEKDIEEQLDSGEAADPDYWAAVLRRLTIYKSRAILREFHATLMQRHLDKMMAGMDLPRSLVGGKERLAQAHVEAQRALEGAEVLETAPKEGITPLPPKEAAPELNAEEIELPEEENECIIEKAVEPKVEAVIDAELEALAAVDIRAGKHGARPERMSPPAVEPAALETGHAVEERVERGEPLVWDEFDAEERERLDSESAAGTYSPRPLPPEHVVGHDVVPEDEDLQLLELLRAQVKAKESQRFRAAATAAAAAALGSSVSVDADRLYRQMVANPRAAGPLLGATTPLLQNLVDSRAGGALASLGEPSSDREEDRFRAIAARSMGEISDAGEAPFGGEVAIESQVYWWHEKYRPRKPKYFNRVHTGYDWNKYNKTHYDSDNPPPKTVQGYKFNVFYPDLIDSSKAPTYVVERDPESTDGLTCILRFSAGPPYEDIAFRIVNKDWELNPKRGFKSVFERGILHLYFNFRRQFYRR